MFIQILPNPNEIGRLRHFQSPVGFPLVRLFRGNMETPSEGKSAILPAQNLRHCGHGRLGHPNHRVWPSNIPGPTPFTECSHA